MEHIQQTTLQERPIPEGYWEERNWAWAHYAEFMKQYPDQWIAALQKGKNPLTPAVLKQLRQE